MQRERMKEEAAQRRAAQEAEKQRRKQERDAAKTIQLSQGTKRKALQKPPSQSQAKKQHVRSTGVAAAAASPPREAPTITTRRGRTSTLPARFV